MLNLNNEVLKKSSKHILSKKCEFNEIEYIMTVLIEI